MKIVFLYYKVPGTKWGPNIWPSLVSAIHTIFQPPVHKVTIYDISGVDFRIQREDSLVWRYQISYEISVVIIFSFRPVIKCKPLSRVIWV